MIMHKNRLIIVAILLIVLGLSGCTWWPPFQEGPPASDAREQLREEKRQQLSEATQKLLAVSPEENPDTYVTRQLAVENALAEYLAVTDSSERDIVLLNHNGSIVILPMSRVNSLRISGKFAPPVKLWKTIGPSLNGELLDLTWISSNAGSSDTLVALFPDSLTILEIGQETSLTIFKRAFPQETLPSLWSAGALMEQTAEKGKHIQIEAITTKLSGALIFQFDKRNQVNSLDISGTAKRSLSVGSWQTRPGQDLFNNTHLPSGSFRSLRLFPSLGKAVVLDSAGYVNLFDLSSMEYLWQSNRAWGNRLFKTGEHSVAVLMTGQSSFVVFDIRKNQMALAGQSPKFHLPVSAVTPATLRTTDGMIVGLHRRENKGSNSLLQFLPRDKIHWKTPVNYAVPELPDYHATLSVISSNPAGDSLNQNVPSNLADNIYQTLFTIDNNRTVQPLLATGAKNLGDWKTWEIYLRRDIRFSDGTALTARDIKSGWESRWRICRSELCPSQWLWQLIVGAGPFLDNARDTISGIEVQDANTLRIHLTDPTPYFIEHLTQPVFRMDKTGENDAFRLSTGPFRITNPDRGKGRAGPVSGTPASLWNMFSVLHATTTTSSPGTPLELGRNPEYSLGYAPISKTQVYPKSMEYSDSLVQKRNIITQVRNQSDLAYYRKLDQVTIRPFPLETIYFIALNPAAEPLTNPQIRRKIAGALDKEVTVNIIDEAECSTTSRFFGPEGPPISDPQLPDSLNPKRPVRITYPGKDLVAQQIAERLAARLSQQDIPHTVPESIPPREFHKHRTGGIYDILIDSFAPQFGTASYNLAALLHQGYVVDANIMVSLHEHLSTIPEEYPDDLEFTLIEDGILVPAFRTKSYAILPASLKDIELRGAYKFDISQSWFPIE